MKLTDTTEELRLISFKMSQYRIGLQPFEVSTFWTTRKIPAPGQRSRQQASLVSCNPFPSQIDLPSPKKSKNAGLGTGRCHLLQSFGIRESADNSAASAASPDYVKCQAVIKSAASAASPKTKSREPRPSGAAAKYSKKVTKRRNMSTFFFAPLGVCLLYTSPSPRDATLSRMPSSA